MMPLDVWFKAIRRHPISVRLLGPARPDGTDAPVPNPAHPVITGGFNITLPGDGFNKPPEKTK
jgi:hypothetical protein